MSQVYQTRRKADSKVDVSTQDRQAHGPALAQLQGGAMPTAEQLGHRVDLPGAIQAKMEAAFGADFSGVELYESQTVADAGAQAMTMGNKIGFAPGALDFSSGAGQALLGHELSHVVSQARGEVSGRGFLDDRALEARADREGALAAAGESVYAGPVTPISTTSTALSAAGPMQAKKKPKISEPTLVSQGNWGQEVFTEAISQRDQALKAEGADKDAIQQQFMDRMSKLSELQDGGPVKLGKSEYTNVGGAALHQMVLNTSREKLLADTALQDRVVSGFNSRMGDELERRNGRGVAEAKQAFRGNDLGEYTAYNDMLKAMVPQEMLSRVYNASRTADPTPIRGVKGPTPEQSIEASSHGAPEAVAELANSVRENAPIMRVLNNSKPAFARSQELGDEANTSEMLMNNFALRALGPQFGTMSSDEDRGTMARRAQMFMSEVNTGTSEAAQDYRKILLPAPARKESLAALRSRLRRQFFNR